MHDQKQPPEIFAERPVRSDFARAQRGRRGPPYIVRQLITVFIICAMIGSGIYFLLGHESAPTLPAEIPTVKSEGNYKQRPEQPGGIDIPHQDVQVYHEIDGKTETPPAVEHLLPPPEQPQAANLIAHPEPAAALQKPPATIEDLIAPPDTESAKTKTTATQDTSPASTPALAVVPTSAPVVAAPTPLPTPTMATAASVPATSPPAAPAAESLDAVFQKVAQQDNSVKPASISVPTSAPASAPTASLLVGTKSVQLASLPDKNAAQALMAKLQQQYASILGDISLRVVQADLGAKGIYYRIQSEGVLADRANKICAAIKSQNGGCILAK